MKRLDTAALDSLTTQAKASPRRRANFNLHEDLADPIQRLAIAMEPDTEVLPHRHPQTWELLYPLRGRFVVLHFDEAGTVTARTVLGAGTSVVENPAGQWHAVLSLDSGGVIFEIKHGPYAPVGADDTAPWCAGKDKDTLLAWYANAQIGDRLP